MSGNRSGENEDPTGAGPTSGQPTRVNRLRTWFVALSWGQKLAAALGATLVAVVTIVSGGITIYDRLTPPTSQLAFEDVGFTNPSEDTIDTLDITVSNTGETIAFINQANLKVEKRWKLIRPYYSQELPCAFVAVYHKYQMKVPLSPTPPFVVRNQRLSQKVNPGGDVDRFAIALNYKGGHLEEWEDYVFLATLTLIYDKGEKRVSEDVLFTEFDVPCVYYYETPSSTEKKLELRKGSSESEAARLISQNKRNIEEIKQIEAPKSGKVKELIQTIE